MATPINQPLQTALYQDVADKASTYSDDLAARRGLHKLPPLIQEDFNNLTDSLRQLAKADIPQDVKNQVMNCLLKTKGELQLSDLDNLQKAIQPHLQSQPQPESVWYPQLEKAAEDLGSDEASATKLLQQVIDQNPNTSQGKQAKQTLNALKSGEDIIEVQRNLFSYLHNLP